MEQLLAQISLETESKNHTCLFTANRNKAALDDFYTLLKSKKAYSDDDFTPDTSAVYWSDIDTLTDQVLKTPIKWERAGKLGGGRTLFGKGISPDDINQGQVGNCWFMAAASSVAEMPGRLEKTFLNTETKLNEAGIYAVNLYTLGVPHTVIVDDYVARVDWGDAQLADFFAMTGVDKSMWGVLLEKAYAKSVGNYWHLHGGVIKYGVRTLTGAPHENHIHKNTTLDALWTELTTHDGKNDIINASTDGNDHSKSASNGLAMGHAYTVLGTRKLSNGVRLVKLRNPWGVEDYKGDWGDTSSKWTDALAKEAGLVKNKKDGVFHMSVEDFFKWFEETEVSFDTTGMKSAYFLRLNDDGTGAGQCDASNKGPKCHRHVLTITSEVAQTVWISAHTWDKRTLPTKC